MGFSALCGSLWIQALIIGGEIWDPFHKQPSMGKFTVKTFYETDLRAEDADI